MPKVICASVECKYNDDNHECTAKEIALNSGNVLTVWDGRKDVWTCQQFEMSEAAKRIWEYLKRVDEKGKQT